MVRIRVSRLNYTLEQEGLSTLFVTPLPKKHWWEFQRYFVVSGKVDTSKKYARCRVISNTIALIIMHHETSMESMVKLKRELRKLENA